MNGKRQTLPKPIAQPAEIKIKPRREEKLSLSINIYLLPKKILDKLIISERLVISNKKTASRSFGRMQFKENYFFSAGAFSGALYGEKLKFCSLASLPNMKVIITTFSLENAAI